MSSTDFAQPVRHTAHQRTSQISIRIALIAAQLAASITAAAAGLLVPVSGSSPVALAAGPITGTVFQDFNANGAQDGIEAGVAGITVTAWQSGTAPISTTTTTDANGLYTFTLAGANARVEFTGLPFGFQSSPVGTSSNTSVRFVATPASGINFGIFQPSAYCQNNPQLITACFTAGDNINGLDQNDTNVYSFPHSASGINPGLQTSMALAKQVGSVFGVAYQRGSGSTFVSAYTKRLASYGPGTGSPTSDGTGTIYRIAADGTVAPFVDLDDLFGPNTTGANPHTSFVPVAGDFDGGAFDAVGKTGLGDIDMGENDSTLWTVNLADRTLYGLPIGNAAVPVAPTAAQVITSVVPTPACVLGTGRPFAVKPFNGLVYVGGVCTSENDGTSANLLAYVYAYNPATAAWTATPVLQFPMNYPRTCVDIFPGYAPTLCNLASNTIGSQANWLPWSSVIDISFPAGYSQGYAAHPQPMFTGIDFVPNGTANSLGTDMVVAFRDRWGDQVGSVDPGPANDSPGGALLNAVPAGDILRASLNAGAPPAGAWTIESNSSSNPVGAFGPTAGAGGNQGPGGGEFYWGDEWVGRHDEIVYGGIVHVSGLSTTVATAMDPLREATSGVIFLNNTDGGAPQTYEVRAPVPYGQITDLDFRKANGMGDIEAMCDSAPIEIGNRVWLDADANGIQDAGESPIAGVQVRLTSSTGGSVVATTDANGEYRFSSAVGTSTPNAVYNLFTGTVVLAPLSVYTLTVDTLQAPLTTYSLTVPTADASPNGIARDSNGVLVGSVAVAGVTTGIAGANNHTYDFGFYPAAPPAELLNLGNLVWYDTNNNGTRDIGEAGVNGVTLELYRDVNGDGVFTPGADGPSLGSQTTAGGGIYNFTGLTTGGYLVVISGTQFAPGTPLAGYCNSTSSDSGNTDVDNRNHGNVTGPTTPGVCVLTPANIVASTVVTLTPGGEPPIPVDTDGTNGNLTIDFGFYQPTPPAELLNLGNLVWYDTNNNGTRDAGETGVDGVTLELYRDVNGDGVFTPGADGASLGSQTTAGGGIYNFTGLTTGGYLVVISGTQFAPGMPLAGYCNSTSSDSGNTDVDNRNHGNVTGPTTPGVCVLTPANIVASTVVTLTPGGEPPIPVDTDGTNGNLTIDFGFYQPTPPAELLNLGNQVWYDTNNNGTLDAGEVGVNGVTLELYRDVNGDGVFTPGADGPSLGSQTTSGGGIYNFTGLTAGGYLVVISGTQFAPGTPLYGYCNSTSTDSGNTNVDNRNHGNVTGPTVPGLCLSTANIVASTVVTLTPGGEPPIPVDTDGTNGNLTIDFGFYRMLLGNLVWNDRNHNGTWEPTEPGVPNVTVRLLNPISTVLQSTTTDASGFYTFTGIISSTYCAEVVPPLGYTNTITTPTSGNPNNDVDHDNNGVIISGTTGGGTVIRSNCMTMTPGAEPFITTTTGTSANPTLDFGLWQPVVIVLSKNAVPAPSTLTQTVQVGVGSRITYTLSVRNDGAVPALNVVLSDVVPADTAFAAGSANPPATPIGNVISWTVPQLNVGQTAQVSFVVTVVSRNGVAIENTAFALSNQTPLTVSNRVVHVFTPTAITLVNFDATATASSVMINWGTGLELDTFGFLLYRSATGNQADRVLITTELIPALGGNSSYRFEDKNVTAGTRYTYWLVEVEQSAGGQAQMLEQGTTSVTFGAAAATNPNTTVPMPSGAAGIGGGMVLQGAAVSAPASTTSNGDANVLAQAAPQAQSVSKIEAAPAAQPAANTNPTTASAGPVSEPGSVAVTGGTNDTGVVADAPVQEAQKPVAQLQTQNTSAGLQPAAEAPESEAVPAADVAQASKPVAAAQPAEPVQASVQSAAQVNASAQQTVAQEPVRSSNTLWLVILAGITLVAIAGAGLVVGVVRQARRRS